MKMTIDISARDLQRVNKALGQVALIDRDPQVAQSFLSGARYLKERGRAEYLKRWKGHRHQRATRLLWGFTAKSKREKVDSLAGLGSFANHAHFHDRGTVERYQKKTGRYTGRMPASYFWRDTLAGSGAKAQEIAVSGIVKKVDKLS